MSWGQDDNWKCMKRGPLCHNQRRRGHKMKKKRSDRESKQKRRRKMASHHNLGMKNIHNRNWFQVFEN